MLQDITTKIDLHNFKLENEFNNKLCVSMKNNLQTPVNTVCAALEMVEADVKNFQTGTNEQKDRIHNFFKIINASLNVINAQLNDYVDYIHMKDRELCLTLT